MSRFRAFGLTFDSELDLPGYPAETDERRATDVLVKRSRLGLPPNFDAERCSWALLEGELTLQFEGLALFRVRDGREVHVDVQPGAAVGDVSSMLVRSVMGAILLQRGYVLMHGAAVSSPEGAICLVGNVGVGKSTLAAALVRRGCALLADEWLALRVDGNDVYLTPGPPRHLLWADTLASMGATPGPAARAGVRKHLLPAVATDLEEVKVAAVFITNWGTVSETLLRRLSSPLAYGCDILFSYRRLWLRGMKRLNAFERMVALLAERVPHFHMIRPMGLKRIDEVAGAVLDRLAELPHSQEQAVTLEPSPAPELRFADPPGFVWLASYPKSGNTWVRAMLTSWLQDGPDQVADSRLQREAPDLTALVGHSRLGERHYFDEMLGVDSDLLTAEETRVWRSRLHAQRAREIIGPRVRKMHDVCERCADGRMLFPPAATHGVVYVVRNPLDVAASYSHHFQMPIAQVIPRMASRDVWVHAPRGGSRDSLPQRTGSWSEHVTSWMESGHRTLVLRYEDLLTDSATCLRKLIDFLEYPWDDARAARVVQSTRFEALQREEQAHGFGERPYDTPTFFREGRSGGWRDALTAEQARQICLDHGDVMRAHGYGADVDEALSR